MKIGSMFFEVIPLISTFFPAIFSLFYDIGKKWQNFIISVLAVLTLFFAYIFVTENFSSSLDVHNLFDIRYNKISIFIGLLYCGSLFVGLFPLRNSHTITPTFLFYISSGLGIILANNLPTFFMFFFLQRLIPLKGFLKEEVGGTYFFQHVLTAICFIALMYFAYNKGLLLTPMSEMPSSFFTWPVLILSFVIVYEAHGIFPFHSWVHDVVGKLPWYEFSAIFLSRAGILIFAQLLLPSLKYDPDIFKLTLLGLSIFSSIYWSMRGIIEFNLTKKTTYFYIAQASLLLTGMQADLTALKGSYLHMMVISISGTSLFSILSYVQQSFSFKRRSQYYGLATYYPKLATLFCLFGFCVIGVPLGPSFVVEDLVITGLLEYHQYLGLGHVLATCLNGILFFLLFTKIFLGPSPYKDQPINMDMTLFEMLPYLLSLVVLISIGLMPSLFLEKITW
jgi:NADH:ubiquinone oxidoreductase subunit 4 (subunit M)